MTDTQKYRLITRADFDGLVCAVLLKERGLIDRITFVHPKDMQDGRVPVDASVITTNLPYVEGCYLAFDHHASEMIRCGAQEPDNHILDPEAPSAARVLYDYYGGKEGFPNVCEEMLIAVDKCDSAQFSREEVLDPTGWVLLSFLMDPRTGLGRFQDFRISNYALMMKLIDYCRKHTVDEILELPDVKERVNLYNEYADFARDQIERCATVHENVVVLDLRGEETIYPCNRFLVYTMHPDCNLSIHVIWGKGKLNTVFAIGSSILNRTSITNIGELCLRYGGGGHTNAGTCQVDHDQAERVLGELIEQMTVSEHSPVIQFS